MLARFAWRLLPGTVALVYAGQAALAQAPATYTVSIASADGHSPPATMVLGAPRTLPRFGAPRVTAGGVQNINGDYTNNATLTASGTVDPQTINISNSTFTQTGGGVLNAADGGLITLNSVNVVGGTLTTSGSGTITASNNGNNFLTGVTLAGTLDLASGTGAERVQNGLTFGTGGTVNINSNSLLSFEGTQTLGGTGTIVFGGTGSGNRLDIESPNGPGTLTIGPNVTIRGANATIGGQNFEGGANALVNNGTIRADVSGGTITIVNAPVTNSGALQAANGGTLVLQSAVTNAGAGQLTATGGGVLYLNGTSITGGTITTSGGGLFQASNSGGNFLNSVTVGGGIDLASNTSAIRVGGSGLTLQNGAAVNINANSLLAFEGTTTIDGNGSVVFGGTGSGNRLNIESPATGTNTLTVGPNVTIHGANGTIGGQNFEGGAEALVNRGTISADVAGGTITIVNAPVTNTGTLSAQNGGTLVLQSNVASSGAGQILAGAGSVVYQNGVTLAGQINTAGSGLFQASASGNNFLSAVTLSGGIDLASAASVERVTGGLTLQNGATISVNSNSALAFEDSQALGGSGTILLGTTGSGNRVNIETPNGGVSTLTIGPNVVIRGTNGTIGGQNFEGGAEALINNGTISAEGNGGTITIVNAPVTNNGTLQAINGGTLVLNSNVTGATGSQLIAGAGSVIYQNGVTLAGQITTSGTGLLQASASGNNFLNTVTFSGALDLASAASVDRVTGGLTLQNGATISVNSNSVLAFEGTQTLGGNGTIVLGATGSGNRINIESPASGVNTLTVGPNITIRGQNGTIGGQNFEGGAESLVNQGTISADVAGGTITIVNAPVTNTGTLQAQNGGTLVLNSNVASSGSGQLLAGNGSIVYQNGVTLAGQINTAGSGVMQASASGNNFLSAATLNGTLDLASAASVERVTGGLTLQNGATISVNSNSALAFEDGQTLGGSGSILFGSTGSGNRLNIESPNGTNTLTVGPNVTIHGANGTIGGQNFEGGAEVLVNNGTINSDGAGTITVVNAPVTNNGTLRAQNGTLTLTTPLTGTGTLQVDAAGVVNLTSNVPVTQGTLAIGGTGATLNNGTQNITLSADYTNASAGVGNAFNRHAGITGTGQILAGGDVAQAITGAGVTNGASPNATLTIGNVRVGANTYTYQIANTGTTGPALRGAIQTSVNGGNITDSRLSGGGVTSSNYGPVAPGAGGAQTVVFTATSAGALAPLSGQAINLRSTYDNIGDQKLNIVLGSGAAAYNAAVGQLNTASLNFGTVQVGQTVSQTLSVSNVATGPNGYVEDLNVGFGAATGTGANRITGAGTVTGLTAGSTNASGLVVTVNTTTAGTVNGAIALNYLSAGTVNGVSNGLGTLNVGGASYGVAGTINGSATVVNQASPVVNNAPIALGNVRINSTAPIGTVSVTNQSVGSPQAALDASIGGNGPITANGSFSLLNPGSTDASSLHVGFSTATAGLKNGTATISFISDAANIGNCGSNCQMTIASQDVAVTGAVYRLASPTVDATPVTLAARVGDAAPTHAIGVTNSSPDAYTERLNASFSGTAPAGFTTAGSIVGLAAMGQSNALTTALNTTTAGTFGGMATIAGISSGAGTTGAADLAVGSTSVALTGKVYTAAVGQVAPTTIDFGIVHVGDAVGARAITVGNAAATTALNDVLRGSVTTSSAGFTAAGTLGNGLAAGASDHSSLTVGLNTGSAGAFTGSAAVALRSSDADLADLGLGSTSVQLSGQVNNYAADDFSKTGGGGLLTRLSATSYVLDFGTLAAGSGGVTTDLAVDNTAAGLADFLNGSFQTVGSGFTLSGFNAFTNIGAGMQFAGLDVTFAGQSTGTFSDVVTLNAYGTNASGYRGDLGPIQLTIRGTVGGNGVTTTPEPGTYALAAAGLLGVGLIRRRQRASRA